MPYEELTKGSIQQQLSRYLTINKWQWPKGFKKPTGFKDGEPHQRCCLEALKELEESVGLERCQDAYLDSKRSSQSQSQPQSQSSEEEETNELNFETSDA
jgi:hypothetical protein